MRLHSIVVALALVVPALAGADDKQQGQPNTGDTTQPNEKKGDAKLNEAEIKVVAHLHHINQMEIEAGKLAERNGTPAVKKYGREMVNDHQTADTALIAFARQHGVSQIPAPKPESDAEKAQMQQTTEQMTTLKKLKGADFDRDYLKMMIDGHEKELARTDSLLAISMNPKLDMLLENRKSTLQRHLEAAKELQQHAPQAVK